MCLAEVRRARFGPGLWPGPRRQARRGAGGAAPDNARRSGLVLCDPSSGVRRTGAMPDGVTSSHRAAPGGVAARTGCGPVAGTPCAAAAADVGPASEGRGEAAAPQRRDPRRP